jgi:hypothetical protein
MSFDINAKELILKDIISKHNTGISSLLQWKEKSKKYYFARNLNLLTLAGSLSTLILYFTKKTSGRQSIYLVAPLALMGLTYIFANRSKAIFNSLKEESGIKDDKKLKEFLYFHRYALI